MIVAHARKVVRSLLALFSLLVLANCAGHGPATPLPSAAQAPYDEYVLSPQYRAAADAARIHLEKARREHGLPSLSAAVSLDGQLVWAGVSGWADIQQSVPASVQTRYRIGSTSKAVTATAFARLVDARRISLDQPISTWLDDLPNPKWNRLTPRQLASHTAGIVNYEQNRDISGLIQSITEKKQYDTVSEALGVFDGNGLKYEPGTGFEYSSFDVILLSAAIEAAAEEPFLDVLESQITKALGNLTISADYQDRAVPGRAIFYHNKKGKLRSWKPVNHSYKWAAGGLVAASSDLVRMGSAWFDDDYISAETREIFWTPQVLSNGSINEQNYALGWRSNSQTILFGKESPVHNVHHGGISKGSFSWLNLYPEYKLAIALNTNARLQDFADFAGLEYPITRSFIEARQSGE